MGVKEGKGGPPICVVVGGRERDVVVLKISIGSMMLAMTELAILMQWMCNGDGPKCREERRWCG